MSTARTRWLLTIAAVLVTGASIAWYELRQARREQQLSALTASLREKFGVDVLYAGQAYPVTASTYEIRAQNPTHNEVLAYVETLGEFALYPRGLVRRSGIRTLVLSKAIVFKDARREQPRTAVPSFERDILYLDVTACRWSAIYRAQALHHEFFHFVDWRDDGQLYVDDEWTKLNEASFAYGSGGAADRMPGTGTMTGEFPGFLSRYARSGVEEDKAETFAWLMVDPERVAARVEAHGVERRKVEMMKGLLLRAAPDANESWWQEILALRRARRSW